MYDIHTIVCHLNPLYLEFRAACVVLYMSEFYDALYYLDVYHETAATFMWQIYVSLGNTNFQYVYGTCATCEIKQQFILGRSAIASYLAAYFWLLSVDSC